MLQSYQRTKMSITASSSLVDDKINGCLTKLEKKINQLIEIVSRLAVPSVQAQAPMTPITKLSSMFEEEDPPSNEVDENPKGTKNLSSTI